MNYRVKELPDILFFSYNNAKNMSNYFKGDCKFQQIKPNILKDLVNNSSEEWYYVGPDQTLVPMASLTERGKEEYEKAKSRAKEEPPKNILYKGILIPTSCGSWYPDKNSPYYKQEDFVRLNCMSDLRLCGLISGTLDSISTSAVMWRGQLENGVNWVITRSGSLYHYT